MIERLPDLTLEATGGETIRLSEVRPAVVAFIPAAFVSVSARDLLDLERAHGRLREAGARLVAIAPDSVASLQVFAASLGGLSFPLCGDLSHEAARAFGVHRDDGFCARATFVADAEGAIRWSRVYRPEDGRAVEDVLAALSEAR